MRPIVPYTVAASNSVETAVPGSGFGAAAGAGALLPPQAPTPAARKANATARLTCSTSSPGVSFARSHAQREPRRSNHRRLPPPRARRRGRHRRSVSGRTPRPQYLERTRPAVGVCGPIHFGGASLAEVYRAEHPDRGPCAFKVLRSRLASDPTAVKRFLREAGYGSRVEHPGVVRTYDYGEADGLYYLALEW